MADDKEDYRAGERHGELLGEVKLLSSKVQDLTDSLREFKIGIGSRIEKIEDDTKKLPVLKELCEDWRDSKKWLMGIVFGTVVMGILNLVLKR